MTKPDFPESDNPYAAPSVSEPMKAAVPGGFEAIRREHLNTEASIQSFGLLYGLGGIIVIIMGLVSMVLSIMTLVERADGAGAIAAVAFVVSLFYFAIGMFQLTAAYGLRRLTQVGRIGGTVLGALGLLAFPVGTIISIYMLYLLWCKKGEKVFSKEYREVIDATPHIKYKTSIIVWIFLGLLLFLVAIGFIGAIAS